MPTRQRPTDHRTGETMNSTNRMEWYEGPSGTRNRDFEIAHGKLGPLEFSLCKRQDADDEFLYRLFAYRDWRDGGGCKHVGGFNDVLEARKAAIEFAYQNMPPSFSLIAQVKQAEREVGSGPH
jgi:hypothetical protein